MVIFNKNHIRELFGPDSEPDHAIIVLEHRDALGNISSPELLDEILSACTNLLSASYIMHFTEKSGNLICCYLNYNAATFSTEAFIGSLRQTLFSLSQGSRSYIFYSENILGRNTLFSERVFLFQAVKYSLLFGYKNPVSADILHKCENTREIINRNILVTVYDDLCQKKYDSIINYLDMTGNAFLNPADSQVFYNYSEMLQLVSDIYAALKLFFHKQNYNFSYLSRNIIELLYENSGIAGVLAIFSDSIKKYRDNFSHVEPSVRLQKNISEILDYVDKNLNRTNLSETAAHFDLTDAYLSRLFKKNTGLNFSDYIKEKKLDRAIKLLQSEEKISVSEVAMRVGIKSQSHFQNMFKIEFGLTPDEYRRNYRLNAPK